MYYTFVYPYFLYCNEVWGSAYSIHLNCLKLLQKRAIRIISKARRNDHTGPLFEILKLLKVEYIHKYLVLQFLFRVKHNQIPVIFENMFVLNSRIHDYRTRQQNEFHLPPSRTTFSQKFISYNGAKLWNDICKNVNDECSLFVFKRNVKFKPLELQSK